jgi:hypothetical protein
LQRLFHFSFADTGLLKMQIQRIAGDSLGLVLGVHHTSPQPNRPPPRTATTALVLLSGGGGRNPGRCAVMMDRQHAASPALWGHGHLPLLARAGSKESLEYILQALWRTRRTGLDAADRAVARDALQLASDAELDPVSTPSSLLTFLPRLPSAPLLAVACVAKFRMFQPPNYVCVRFFNLCCSCWCA